MRRGGAIPAARTAPDEEVSFTHQAWQGPVCMLSAERGRLIEQVQPFSVGADDFYISSGLDFWFTPAGARAKLPVCWKQYLLTWSAIYPLALALGVPVAVVPALRMAGVPGRIPITTLAVTAVVVFLMVYVAMPRYTPLVQRWLFTSQRSQAFISRRARQASARAAHPPCGLAPQPRS